MESAAGRQGISSDSWSELEKDQVVKGKRSYECNFCKRGFTNAQALGGHMNLHRKHRSNSNSKAKQQPTTTTSSSVPTEVPSKYYPVFDAQRTNNRMNFQPPLALCSPSLPYANCDGDFLVPLKSPSFSMMDYEENLGANLSLRIGPSNVDHDHRGIMKDDDEVDLELRLGPHHP